MDTNHAFDSLEPFFDLIESADTAMLQEIMSAIRERYEVLHPDWDILYLALPKKDHRLRRDILTKAAELLNE